ncbi:SKI family transcriptional corepressor 2 [Folsomia candida]|uniref:SKI family transcriptional corepressor 2 n=1 Tax=Folsomia candida TaxID=158441 RepID=A0A226EWR1_FOLCA|nr:SKI family transcriptional corepressor 2 [Folsomia candida]
MCDTTGVTSISLRNPDLSPMSDDSNSHIHHHHHPHAPSSTSKSSKHGSGSNEGQSSGKQNQVGSVMLFGVPIVSLVMEGKERLCLAQISSTLLKDFSYNEIHNRRVALGITCVQCTPVQLEILRRAGAMPVTSRRCGMITRREAERLCQSFLGDHAPPQLPENFAFEVYHQCGWGCRGSFVPSRYNSSRNFNSWRRHLKLCGDPPEDDVRAMFNGGTRKRMLAAHSSSSSHHHHHHTSSRSDNQVHRRGGGGKQSSSNSGTSPSSGGGQNNGSSKQAAVTPQQPPSRPNHHHNHHNHHAPPTNHINGPTLNPLSSSPGFISTLPLHHPTSTSSPSTNHTSSSPSNFLSSTNPLLSPSGIWNPGLSPVSMNSGRLNAGSQLSHLSPFHPLSIPWLRPMFPFPHPCHLLAAEAAGISVSEKLAVASLSAGAGRSTNQSAFKPVSHRSNAEHLFSWLNNNNSGVTGASGGPTSSIILGGTSSLPEDLSTTSSHNNQGHDHSHHPILGHLNREQRNSSPQERPSVSSTNDENDHPKISFLNTKRGGTINSSSRHQIALLSSNAAKNDSDDEENVDIEEVEEEEEYSSTSLIWVTSTNNNNNNNSVNINISRKKLSVDSNSGEESCSGEDEKFGGSPPKRKRLWDFDASDKVKKAELAVCCDETTRTSGFESKE